MAKNKLPNTDPLAGLRKEVFKTTRERIAKVVKEAAKVEDSTKRDELLNSARTYRDWADMAEKEPAGKVQN